MYFLPLIFFPLIAKKIDAEFVPLLIFLGALGNTLQLRTLIEANELNLRNKKKLYLFWPKRLKPNNNILFEYFKKFLKSFKNSISAESSFLGATAMFVGGP